MQSVQPTDVSQYFILKRISFLFLFFLAALGHAASLSPQPTVSSKGLSSLHFAETGAREWVPNFGTGSPGGEFKCYCDWHGNHYNNPTRSEVSNGTLAQEYPWGTCTVTFSVEADKTLAVTGLIVNTTGTDLPNVDLNLCKIGCPKVYPDLPPTINCAWDPGYWSFDGSSPEIPCWFAYSVGKWPGTIVAGQPNWSANALYARGYTLKAGESVEFSFRLNFVTAADDLNAVRDKTNQSFAAAYPQTHWTSDLRSIGQVFFVTGTGASGWASDHNKWATNPRGWLGDPTINISDKAAFKSRMESFCRQCVANADSIEGIRGFVIWDIEGEQYLHGSCVYVGHPSKMSELAPEMDEIADHLLSILKANGKYQIGFCLRQQEFVKRSDPNQPFYFQAWANPDGDAARQDLEFEIEYVRMRWGEGVTMFYVDSNEGTEVHNYQALSNEFPTLLIYPESFHVVTRMYNSWPQYQTGRQQDYVRNGLTTQGKYLDVYPNAQSVINLADVPNSPENVDKVVSSMLRGDVQQVRIWWTGGSEYPLLKSATDKAIRSGWPSPSPIATPTPQPTATPEPSTSPSPSPSPSPHPDSYRDWFDDLANWILHHPPLPDH